MKKSDLQIIAKTELTDVPSLRRILLQLPSVTLMLTGLALMLHSAFPSVSGIAVAVAFAVVGAVLLLLCNTGKDLPILPVVIVILTVACVALSNIFASSAVVLINDITEALTGITGKIYLESAGSGNPIFEAICFIVLFAILSETAAASGSVLPLIPVMVITVAGAYIGVITSITGMVLFIGGILFIPDIVNPKTLFLRLATVAVCGLVTFTAVHFLLPEADFSSVGEAVHSVIYDDNDNAMPEGKIDSAGTFDRNDSPALDVTMSKPSRLYLRGKAYDTYTGTSWETADTRKTAAFENNFYWLHKYGFYSQLQVGLAMQAAGETGTENITVKIRNACSEYMYVPYGLLSPELMDEDLVGDPYVPAGSGEAAMTVAAGSVADYYALQQKISSASGEKADSYRKNEESYASYVDVFDLQLPDECRELLDREFSGENADGDISDTLGFIRDYLDSHLTYNENAGEAPDDTDFLTYVLESSGGGYSVHYATAAVLMLRYFGIPARYAEGYYLSTADSRKYQPDETITLTEDNAHAWAEFYLDGVGFIPFEVTPGYVEDEDPGRSSGSGTENESSSEPDDNEDSPSEDYEDSGNDNVPPEEVNQQSAKYSRGTAWFIIIILILLDILIVTLIRRQRLKSRLKSADEMTPRGAVTLLYGYAVLLREKCGITTEDDERMAALNSEARYSRHRISEESRREMKDYVEKVRTLCLANSGFFRKFRLKYIDCIIR